MRLSTAIAELSELLQRTDDTKWGEKELGSYIHRHVVALSRRMVELDAGYFNHTLRLALTEAKQFKADSWEYDIPQWCERIVDVRQLTSTTTPTQGSLGGVVPQIHKYETRGWRRNGPGVLQLKSYGSALDLEITCAKRPARPTKGTLPTQANLPSPNTSYVRLDLDSSSAAAIHPHETLANSYANAIIEITSANARAGQIRRVIGSTHFVEEPAASTNFYTVLELDRPWTTQPQGGDTYELHLEIAEEHCDVVLGLAANSAWGARGNYDQQKAMASLLSRQVAEFERHITPRDIQTPRYLRHSIGNGDPGPAATEDTQRPLWV